MSAYTKAASFILDTLWQDDGFREHFHRLGVSLADLGHLVDTVFVPAYLWFKRSLDPADLARLQKSVVVPLIIPLLRQPSFREMWEQWDQATQLAFVREQTELPLAKLLIQVYHQQLDAAFRQAYARYSAQATGRRE